jgi:hypothetical protein
MSSNFINCLGDSFYKPANLPMAQKDNKSPAQTALINTPFEVMTILVGIYLKGKGQVQKKTKKKTH